MHKCIEKVDQMLKEYNTGLTLCFGIDGNVDILVSTHQLKKGRGQRKCVSMCATYCPFCGDKLRQQSSDI